MLELRGLISESRSTAPLHAAAHARLRVAGQLSPQWRARAHPRGRACAGAVGEAVEEACQ